MFTYGLGFSFFVFFFVGFWVKDRDSISCGLCKRLSPNDSQNTSKAQSPNRKPTVGDPWKPDLGKV